MALSQTVLLAMNRYGGSTVATRDSSGVATQRHPAAEDWYTAAQADESAQKWTSTTLFAEAMAAKAAHLCLKFPSNVDAVGRGLIESEPLMSAEGARNYKYDYTDREWWQSTQAGAAYIQFRARLGANAGPRLCR